MYKLIDANTLKIASFGRRNGKKFKLVDMSEAKVIDAIPTEWLIGKAAQAERDLYYCKGDAKKNAGIMAAVRVVMGMWQKEGKDAQSNGHGK